MKTKISLLVVSALVLTLVLGSCSTQEEKSTTTNQNSNSEKATYSCPMHPEVTSDVAGKCPKCGMELIEKTTDNSSMDMSNDTTQMGDM